MSFKDVNDSINKIMGSMMDLFYPRRCPFCGAIVGKELLCKECKKTLPWCEKIKSGANFKSVTAPLYYEDGFILLFIERAPFASTVCLPSAVKMVTSLSFSP